MTDRRPGRLRGLRSRMIATFALATLLWILILAGAAAFGIKLGLGEGLAETRRTISLINWTQSTIDRIEELLEEAEELPEEAEELPEEAEELPEEAEELPEEAEELPEEAEELPEDAALANIDSELLQSDHEPQPRIRIVGLDGTVLHDTAPGNTAPGNTEPGETARGEGAGGGETASGGGGSGGDEASSSGGGSSGGETGESAPAATAPGETGEPAEGATVSGGEASTPARLSAEDVLRLIPASDPAEPLHGTGQQIRVHGELWGFLILTFAPGEEVYRFVSEPERLWRTLSRTLIAGLFFSLLAVYLTFYAFARGLVVPLRELAFQVSRIGEGELPEPTEWPERSDEIGVLAGSLNDMTHALSQTRERLTLEDTRRRLMVSALGHDLRTPVTAIISHTEALENGAATDPEHSLSTIHRRAEHMQHLIADLLAYASVDTTPNTEYSPIDIAEMARETVISILPRFEQRSIEVDVFIPDSRIELTGSRRALERVFDNMLGNALEHATGATWVGVFVRESIDSVTVAVQDNGPGIPEHMDIFEPFKKGSTARTGSERGSGIGLAIVRDVVTAHGGQCGAERRQSGGSTIWFEIPKTPYRTHRV